MAYTYDDFLKSATDTGLLSSFDADDLVTAGAHPEYGMSMLSLYRDLSGAQTDEQRALISEAQNQLRGSYRTKDTRAAQNNGYNSVFQDQIDDLTNKAVNQGSFNFSLKDNPLWSTYKKNYLREGDRAAANALATASTASAGRPSSYAITASQQANDYYDTQLANIIPQLYSQDYSVWADSYNRLLQNLNALRDQDNSEYARFLDQLNLQYQRERDAVGDEQQNFSNALAIYQILGAGSPDWVLQALGITGTGGAGVGVGGTGGSGSGGYGGYHYDDSGSFVDEYGNSEETYQRVQNIIDNWSQGKFGGGDVNTIADTPGILEILLTTGTDAYGNSLENVYVPTDQASRRRIANQLLLDQYGDWQDRGYLKDQWGNFIPDENGNPTLADGARAPSVTRDENGNLIVDYGTGTGAGTWTADDQREEQMMIRRMNAVEASMDPALNEAWDSLKQSYRDGLISKDVLQNELYSEYLNGDLSFADWNILKTRVNALPSDPSQVGTTGTQLPIDYTAPIESITANLGGGAASEWVINAIRSALKAKGIDTSAMTDDQIRGVVSEATAEPVISAVNGRTYTGTSQKAQNPEGPGGNVYAGILDNAGNTAGQSNLEAAVNVIRDWGSGVWNDLQNYLSGISGAEAAALTPEGRTEAAAAIDALRNFESRGNKLADAEALKQIASMNQSLYYDPTEDLPGAAPGSGTVKSTAPLTGDTSGSALAGIIGNWAASIAAENNQPGLSDAEYRQMDTNDAWSPNWENGETTKQTGNVLATLLDNLRNAAKNVASRETAPAYTGLTDAEYRQMDTNDAWSPNWENGETTKQTSNILATLLDNLRNARQQTDAQQAAAAQQPATGSGPSGHSTSTHQTSTGGISLTNALSNLVSGISAQIKNVQAAQQAAQTAAEQQAAEEAAAQAAAAAAAATASKTGANGRTYTGTSQKAQNPANTSSTPSVTQQAVQAAQQAVASVAAGNTVKNAVQQAIATAKNNSNSSSNSGSNSSSGKNVSAVVTKPNQKVLKQ